MLKSLKGLSLVLIISSTAVLGVAPPAHAVQPVLDGGFESAVAGNSPSWTEADSLFGSPICDTSCGGAGPHTGSWWAWFGGGTGPQTSSITQSVTIAAGNVATLEWFMRASHVADPFNATLTIKMDDAVIATYQEPTNPEDSYLPRELDLTMYADGAPHTLGFFYNNPAADTTNFHVDDIGILVQAVTGTPTVTGTSPTGPSSSATPMVTGTAEADSTVSLYGDSACTNFLGAGSAADFAGGGVTAMVATNTTNTIYAKATKPGQVDSACSTSFAIYTHDSIAPSPPADLATDPSSPSPDSTVILTGDTEPGGTVAIFTNGTCSGSSALETASENLVSGIEIGVSPGQTKFSATATDAAGNTSGCSDAITYVQQDAPETTLTKKPAKKVKTTKKRAKVTFGFASSINNGTFMCSIDGKPAKACTSPKPYRLKPGKHTFAVYAVVNGVRDDSPATHAFKVKRKKR